MYKPASKYRRTFAAVMVPVSYRSRGSNVPSEVWTPTATSPSARSNLGSGGGGAGVWSGERRAGERPTSSAPFSVFNCPATSASPVRCKAQTRELE